MKLRAKSNDRMTDDYYDDNEDDDEYLYSEYYDDEIIDTDFEYDYEEKLPGSTAEFNQNLDPDFGTIPLSEQLKDKSYVFWCIALFLFTCFTYNMEDIARMNLQAN